MAKVIHNIDMKELHLLLMSGKSLTEIAKIKKCHIMTIIRKMKESNVKLKTGLDIYLKSKI